ncbi:hypothetical protein, conserved [Eimeria brunetti]|uniref:CTLH domain-containing protein n=1 Tax=Eimeria brunetti TaxID=51314 RepID=U6LM60_9EIME|nr:hypothetical protein, conserved [Eimeria brunetti]
MSGRNQTAHSGSFYEDVESDWMRKLGEAEVFESDLQHLILNYLTINGLAGPAEEFIKEARVDPQMPLHCIDCRAKIREAILSGQTEEAIRQIGSIDPNLLNADAEVTFLLHKQQLLRLIEAEDLEEAIDFAQQRLAPCVKECPHLLPQLEEVMALLAFNDLSCPEAQRLIGGMEQREETARRIDEAILDLYRIEQESALELLAKNVLFSQGCLQNTQRSLCPVVVDIRRGTLGRSIIPTSGRGPRVDERTDIGGAQSGGESGTLQIDAADRQPQQELQQEGHSHRHSQAATSSQVPATTPRRTQERDQSRDFGRRRRTGGAPP